MDPMWNLYDKVVVKFDKLLVEILAYKSLKFKLFFCGIQTHSKLVGFHAFDG